MKTCLYCGGNNTDSAKICMICGRDLDTGAHVSRGNGLTADADKRGAARLALPRPESSYANLLLIAPIVALFLMGLAVIFGSSWDYYYDLALPKVNNVGFFGGGLVLLSLGLLIYMISGLANSFRVHKGYRMILREEGGDTHPLIRCYNRYRERTTSFRCLLWALPMILIVLLMSLLFMGYVAYYVVIFGVRVALPEVDDPLPYVLLLSVGLAFLVARFVVAFRATLAYRRYKKFLKGESVRNIGNARTGLAAALDARQYPQPETPYVYLLLLPAILVLLLFAMATLVAPNGETFMGMIPPLFAHPTGAALLMAAAAAALGIAAILCFRKQKAVTRGYFEALRMTEDTPFSAYLEKYAHYQKQACDFYCFLWLLPVALFVAVMQLLYISSYAHHATILGQYTFVLPEVEEPLPFILMSVVSIIFLAILFFVTLNNTLAYRRADVANRKRHREEDERAAEAAAAEAAAAEAAEQIVSDDMVAEEAEESLWGDHDVPAEGAETPTQEIGVAAEESADDFGAFLSAEESSDEAAVSEMDRLDPLERLRVIDAFESAPIASHRSAKNLHELCEWFMSFAKANGYQPEISSVRAILAAMVTSRVVFIRTRDDASAEFASKLSKFFGSNAPVAEVTSFWDSPDALLFNTSFGSKRATDCLCGLYRAGYAGDAICTLTLTNAQKGSADLYLKDMLAYAEKPERAGEMCLLEEAPSQSKLSARVATRNDGVYMPMSENVWCLAVSSDATKYAIPEAGYTIGSALAVCLRGKACEPVAEETPATGLSATEFRRLVRGLTEHYFLPEEQWKKFDRIENFLQARAGVRFDNRLMRRLETFSSAYLAVDNDPNQILDAMLEAIFLPMIARLDPAALGSIDGSAGICETMALSFGADNIPYCMQTLHELGFEA